MNSFETDLYRAVLSIRFIAAVAIQLLILLSQGPDSSLFKMSVPLACTLPYACGWLDEYKSGFFKLSIPRGTLRGYILGKFLAAAISGGGAEVLAAWLFTFIKGETLAIDLGLLFLSAALWAAAAAILAALSDSKYLAYGGSFVIYYFLVILCERYWPSLYCLYPYEWLSPKHTWVLDSTGIALMLTGLLLILGLWYYSILSRRIERA